MARTKKSAYPEFAERFNDLIGYKGEKDRKARPTAAEKIGVSAENVRVWSAGLNLPNGEALLKIKKAYPEISVDFLLFGDQDHRNENATIVTFPSQEKSVSDIFGDILREGDEGTRAILTLALQGVIKMTDRDRDIKEIKDLLERILKTSGLLKKTNKGRAPGTPEEGESGGV